MTVREALHSFGQIATDLEALQSKHDFIVSFSSRESVNATMILNALEHFGDIVRYSNVRRTKSTTLAIESENDVQDAIYFMLKPWIRDLAYESPTNKEGGRFAVKDFRSRALRTAIEAKFVRNQSHGREITKEIHDDIEMYSRTNDIDTIIFFIYDPNSLIGDPDGLKDHLEIERIIGGRTITVRVLIKP